MHVYACVCVCVCVCVLHLWGLACNVTALLQISRQWWKVKKLRITKQAHIHNRPIHTQTLAAHPPIHTHPPTHKHLYTQTLAAHPPIPTLATHPPIPTPTHQELHSHKAYAHIHTHTHAHTHTYTHTHSCRSHWPIFLTHPPAATPPWPLYDTPPTHHSVHSALPSRPHAAAHCLHATALLPSPCACQKKRGLRRELPSRHLLPPQQPVSVRVCV